MFITLLARWQQVFKQFWDSVSGYPGNKPIRFSIDYPGQGNFHQAVIIFIVYTCYTYVLYIYVIFWLYINITI